MPAQMLLLLLLVLLALTIITLAAGKTGYPFPIAKPGCPESCGNMSIPYPFGTTLGCSLNPNFHIRCGTNGMVIFGKIYHSSPPAMVGESDVEATEIMLLQGEARLWMYITHLCKSQENVESHMVSLEMGGTVFTLSHLKNKFTVIGCDAIAHFNELEGSKSVSECKSSCQRLEDVVNGTCNGVGCCQTSVPTKIKGFNITLERGGNTAQVDSSSTPCNSAFVVEQSNYTFSSADFTFSALTRGSERPDKPAIFDWAIGTESCSDAQDLSGYVCGANSVCVDYDNGPGYRCNCSDGFRGNPYLAKGCKRSDSSMLSGSLTRSWIGLLSCVLLLKMLNGGTF